MIISSQFTPFSSLEVKQVLKISNRSYKEAVDSGVFKRSVHFDGRVSNSTATHSLFDIVEFVMLVRASRIGFSNRRTTEWLDHCLDSICAFIDWLPETYEMTSSEELGRLFKEFIGTEIEEDFLRTEIGTKDDLISIHDVVNVWSYFYQRLKKFLVIDAALAGKRDLLGRSRADCSYQFLGRTNLIALPPENWTV